MSDEPLDPPLDPRPPGRPAGPLAETTPGRALPANPIEPGSEPGPTLPPGTLVADRYKILQKIAAGGMGEVYRAEHVELGRHFALKVMLPEFSRNHAFVERFRREAAAATKIGHPNIVDITDFGKTGSGAFFFAMELLEGKTLAQLLREEGAMPVERVLHLAAQLCRALAAAHAQGIIHRDLKPENVMVLQRSNTPDLVKILDFGLAKLTGPDAKGLKTRAGMILGTPQYMSPEQAGGQGVDARSDIYSLGLMLWELLVGLRPFYADTAELLLELKRGEVIDPAALERHGPVPPRVRETILKMLRAEPAHRPQAIEEVLTEFARASVMSPPPAPTRLKPAAAPIQLVREAEPAPVAAGAAPTGLSQLKPAQRLWLLPVVGLVGAAIVLALSFPRAAPQAAEPKPSDLAPLLEVHPAPLPPVALPVQPAPLVQVAPPIQVAPPPLPVQPPPPVEPAPPPVKPLAPAHAPPVRPAPPKKAPLKDPYATPERR